MDALGSDVDLLKVLKVFCRELNICYVPFRPTWWFKKRSPILWHSLQKVRTNFPFPECMLTLKAYVYRKKKMPKGQLCGFGALAIQALLLPASCFSECSSGGRRQPHHEDTQAVNGKTHGEANCHVGDPWWKWTLQLQSSLQVTVALADILTHEWPWARTTRPSNSQIPDHKSCAIICYTARLYIADIWICIYLCYTAQIYISICYIDNW